MSIDQSAFRPVGPEQVLAKNRWFSLRRQPVDILNRATGALIKAAARTPIDPKDRGGEQNWLDVTPGALIVAVRGDSRTGSVLLVPQERYTVNLIEGHPVMHYELPGGAFEAGEEDQILAAAERELAEEAGVNADDFTLVGPARGHMPHSLLADRNVLVVARGVKDLEGGARPDADEAIGASNWHTWDETEVMSMEDAGLWRPDGPRVISADPTISGLLKAQRWLGRQEAA